MRKKEGLSKAFSKYFFISILLIFTFPDKGLGPRLANQTIQKGPRSQTLVDFSLSREEDGSPIQAIETGDYRDGQPWYSLGFCFPKYNCKQESKPEPLDFDWECLININASYYPGHFRIGSYNRKIIPNTYPNKLPRPGYYLPTGVDLDTDYPALCLGMNDVNSLGLGTIRRDLFVWIDTPSPPDPTPTPPDITVTSSYTYSTSPTLF